jgi:hypothetical protein
MNEPLINNSEVRSSLTQQLQIINLQTVTLKMSYFTVRNII